MFFLDVIFRIFNTMPTLANFGVPSKFWIRNIENSFVIKLLLKFYKDDIEVFLKNESTTSLVFNKDIFIISYDNKMVFYNSSFKKLVDYQLKYIANDIIKIDEKTVLVWGKKSIKFQDRNYFISSTYITLLDISEIYNVKKLYEIEDYSINIKTIIKVDTNLLAASINKSIVLFDITDKSNMFVYSEFNTKYPQKELIVINKNELLCNEDLLRLDINNPTDIKLIEVNYSMAYNSNLINLDNKRVLYYEYYERGGRYLKIKGLPLYNKLGSYPISHSFNSIILFDTNIIAILAESLILIDITNEKEFSKISEFCLKKYQQNKKNMNHSYIIKLDKNTIFYICRPNIVVLNVSNNYKIREINSFDFF